jgi:phthiocerol/phenolphthiocerol synthesis type-I polyketide synthase B
MARKLLDDEPVFARSIAELEPVFVEQVGYSLWDILSGSQAISGDAQVQPVLMGLQLGLTDLWRSYGVHPDAVIGHSMGEVTAAVVSGALSVADGLKVIGVRSRLMSRMAGQGAVALLNLDADAVDALIADHPGVEVAGYLSPRQTVIAGPVEPVDALIAAVSAQNKFARRVNMEVASHTALMDPILAELRSALADITPRKPRSRSCRPRSRTRLLDADYWAANVRNPARLMQAVTAAAAENTTFIEVSAHPILTHAMGETLESLGHHHTIGTLWRDGDDTVRFHTSLNATHTNRPRTRHTCPNRIRCCRPRRGCTTGTGWTSRGPAVRRVPRNLAAWTQDDDGAAGLVFTAVWPVVDLPEPPADAAADAGRWLVIGDGLAARSAGRWATLPAFPRWHRHSPTTRAGLR